MDRQTNLRVDDASNQHRYNGEAQVLHGLHEAVRSAEVVLGDDKGDHGPERRREHAVRDSHQHHWEVGVDECVGQDGMRTNAKDDGNHNLRL